jgi:sugar phosphate isomerase/epimerase
MDPDTLSICIDTGHAHKLGYSPAQSIEEAGKYLAATHLHDNEGSWDQHLPLFSGGIEWDGVIKALRRIDYDKPVIAEIRGDEDLHIGDNRVLLTGLAMARLKLRPS